MGKGLYIAYVTGSAGSTIILYYIGGEIVAGVDATGTKFDGSYRIDEAGALIGVVTYLIEKGTALITGQTTAAEQRVDVPFTLPHQFWDGRIVRIETPFGAVNAKFEKLKDLP